MAHNWLTTIIPVDLDKAMTAMGLKGKFTREDVHKAYHKRVKDTQCHPDSPGGGDVDKFKRLTAARDLLIKSFDKPPPSRNFGANRTQKPLGAPKLIDEVLQILRTSTDLDEAINRVERLRS